ncbi:MAG: cation:proton antiporter [Crocinitomicaceae bacterium]|nr:cation:proton antiporter [Crocinitomicaceae bacterium]MDG1658158.1 cation:proton antiporter [Crocinitomicaceae bacterium]MDG2440813.1 cation:proton antiporter [Crocinitomicaceae bacterium]|tara:strand:+ start:1524 stop:2822 length:1299 start_codon:yes stop_codon:yes gene_type:complete
MNTYLLIIALASIIILSFFFNIIAKRTNIPAVLMLIGLGMILKSVLESYDVLNDLELDSILEVLGNVGLVMIVLEAALDLKLEKSKTGLILKSLLVAFLGIGISMFALAAFFLVIFPSTSLYTAVVYAIPLSIMSSAIIIPSVGRLTGEKKEFMIYESTFSDILGIMVFYFMIGADGGAGGGDIVWEILLNIGFTILISVVVAYVMVYLFQHLQMQVKLFLVIGVLLLLFAVGKYYHLSSLLIILTFGVVLNNTDVFFRGRLASLFDKEKVKPILHDFHNLTLESAFLIRTFFFVVFGLSITLSSLYNWQVAINSLAIVAILFAVRYLALRLFAKDFLFPELFIAPRGLITVLLFFVLAKNEAINIPDFDAGLLLYPILITSIIMMIALISYKGEKVKDVLFLKVPLIKTKNEEGLNERMKENTEKQDFDGF